MCRSALPTPASASASARASASAWSKPPAPVSAAPQANDYYPKIGFEHHPRAWVRKG